ncbi:MAG: hypothetical protein KGO96_09840 [Elusimicrobia bacterium]|nr:hypothetical protein [Elusimicrobiota bacterium]MDE2426190.1 hypothetical protein [Elusimicrobiota bacterium]
MKSLLERRQRHWRRQALRVALLDGATRLCCAALLALAAAVWLDEALALPRQIRLFLLAAGAMALLYGAWRLLILPLARVGERETLARAEARWPQLRSLLLPAWELSRGPLPEGVSRSLRDAHLEQAEACLAGVADEPLFRWRPDPRLIRAAALAALAALSLGWAPAGAFGRLLLPWNQAPLERYVSISPGDARPEWARSVTLSASWRPGFSGERGGLSLWLGQEGGWRRASWSEESSRGCSLVLDGLTAPLRYRVEWRDLRSRVYTLTPVLPLRLEPVLARLRGPVDEEVALGPGQDLEALRGALVTISGRPNQPLSRAWLRLSSLPRPLRMRRDPAGEYRASFVAETGAALSLDLEAADGRRQPDSAVYQLKVRRDQPPSVQLLSPLGTVLASPSDSIPVSYLARDDAGLSRVSLLLRPAAGKPYQITLLRAGGREASGDYALPLSGFPLGRLELRLKAIDTAAAPQSALSAAAIVDVEDLQGGHERALRLWRRARGSVDAALESSQNLAAASKDMSALAAAMRGDPYSNAALADEVGASAEGLAASSPGNPRTRERLEAARALLERGRPLQDLEDLDRAAERLSQAASPLESAAAALARGKAATRNLARAQAALAEARRGLDSLQRALESLPKVGPASSAARNALRLPLGQARSQLDALSRALERGDYRQAELLARRLSRELARIQRAIGQAAGGSREAALPDWARLRLERARAQWEELAKGQARLIERTQELEEAKVQRRLEEQRRLLGELERRQEAAIAAALSSARLPAGALAAMRAVRREFKARAVRLAPALLDRAARAARASGAKEVASEEEAVAAALRQGVGPVALDAGGQAEAEGSEQASLAGRTELLRQELESLEDETGASAREAIAALASAHRKQAQAAASLNRRDGAAALPAQRRALELLTRGQNSLEAAAAGQSSRRLRLLEPFKRSTGALRLPGGEGEGGSERGFVALPAAGDYLPPKQLRQELERSLRERRPASQDALIKEYFKRIAQ